jgi:hypothetical protein
MLAGSVITRNAYDSPILMGLPSNTFQGRIAKNKNKEFLMPYPQV